MLIVACLVAISIIHSQRSEAFTRVSVPRTSIKELLPGEVLPVPTPFIDPALSIRAKAQETPLHLTIAAVGLEAEIIGVGSTKKNAMDAPMGKANNPDWQQAFWYRGSAIPGELSTAIIAGHVDDPLGQPAVFAHLDSVIIGDEIVIHDNRTGLDVTFGVTEVKTYTLKETKDPSVLNDIYGTGPVSGQDPQISPDKKAHLTLITCAGTFVKKIGTHDQRLVVYATRVG